MEYALDKALKEMSLEDDQPIVLQDHAKFVSSVRNTCSIIGKLLCPENQKMSSLIHEMPRVWRVYNRVRGIALPNDKFQFIFDSEADLSLVLQSGAWTFNDWSLTLERWVENPPSDFLKVLPIWVRIRHIPVNYLTVDTIKEIAGHIGRVTDIAFDPLKPLSRGYVRVRVLFDINKPLKNRKELKIPSGEVVEIGFEYERIRKRCYHCLRLTHDKLRCPLLPSNRQSSATGEEKGQLLVPQRLVPRISNDDPLFGVLTDDDVGIDVLTGKPKIAKEVLDEMRDIEGQKTLLRLEAPTRLTADADKDKGLVFDFEHSASSIGDGDRTMSPAQNSVQSQPIVSSSAFLSGHGATGHRASFSAGSSGTTKYQKKRRRPSQWRRKAQATLKDQGTGRSNQPVNDENDVVVMSKRKACDEVPVSAKVAKHDARLGGTLTIPYLREMRRLHFPDFLFLLETKNSRDYVVKLQRSLGYEYSHIVDPVGLSGGLALFWKPSYEVEVISADHRIIDVKAKLGSLSFYVSCVYGDPVSSLRQGVWDSLVDIGVSRDAPWLVIGDLNEMVSNTEKLGGPARAESSFFPFRNMILDCRLREVSSIGNRLSWAGKRNNMWIQCCLDRALGNEAWFQLFPRVQGEYMERIGSDHRALLLRLANDNVSRSGRFIFNKRWISKPDFAAVVQSGWNKGVTTGQTSVMSRIAECRRTISGWKRSQNLNSKVRIQQVREQLDAEGTKIHPNFQLMRDLRWELAENYRAEELYWKERSREQWLQGGDRNTKFFHGSVQRRRIQNKILSLFDENGVEQFSEGSKGEVAVAYFRKMFTSSNPSAIMEALDGMVPRVTDSMNAELIRPVSALEIKNAVFSIKGEKTPGADGMSSQFFKEYWDVVGPQVVQEVQQFFASGHLPSDWNFTQICLIPKVQNPTRMTNLRPISLCSVLYKTVSKVLCQRLKRFLPKIVSDTQGAFVSGRLITDNILLAHELVHALQTKAGCNEEFLAIKTDMSKAYDRVEWNFLEELLIRLGFDIKWVNWIMSCVRSVTFSVLINGKEHGFIKPERGIRQGDPLSPFLFILCAEALVHVMNKAEQEGRLTGLKLTPECPSIQHLLFADDSLFLCRASLLECSNLLQCLRLYGDASGQEINLQKSSITFGKKLDPYMRRVIGLFTGIEQEGGAGKYLGLPECFSGSKKDMLAYITDRLTSRLRGWFEKTLSLGGKEVLLKAVALALPVYAMSCFRLSKHQCKKITSVMANFWWNAVEEKQKMHWVSWEKMCKSKDQGGLGFRDIGRFNQALLAKQAWRLLDAPSSLLARVYKARYFPSISFMEANLGPRPSYAWRSILFGRELLEKGLMKSIGDGLDTNVWLDKWVFDELPRRPCNKEQMINLNLRVSELITNQGDWNLQALQELFPPCDVIKIRSFPPDTRLQDRLVWAYTNNGHYSVKSGYWLSSKAMEVPGGESEGSRVLNELKQKVWTVETAPKIRMFLWRVLSGAIAVADCMRNHGLQVNPICQVCRSADETVSHALFLCPVASTVWSATALPLPVQGFSTSVSENIGHCLRLITNTDLPSSLRLAIPWILWEIWKARNGMVFNNKLQDHHVLIAGAVADAEEWLKLNELQKQEQRSVVGIMRGGMSQKRWTKPAFGILKCNINASWASSQHYAGGAWILRNHVGDVLFHSRHAFLPTVNRIAAELQCLLWCLESLQILQILSFEVWTDCDAVIQALEKPQAWPKYRSLLHKISQVMVHLQNVSIHLASPKSNGVVRSLANSVTRDGRLNSYLAMGGPAWLHEQIARDSYT
ncbi:PREDICTED: uncharacterized protein LOC104789794 [Camelina sativa]|uniref:Uncharacterized protein LOC104789794 n=1 Tax=Camelina sativa TaxID=90675 RepID=A0ABM0ZCD0_CAMSA|nr:PREDICTED: uncharacterized protein LOC104789794 [Camelina sativa]